MASGRDRRERAGSDDRAVYIISVAAELAGVHPQTLRIYERKGLLRPARTAGNTRRYSQRDIDKLRMIQELTQVRGLNLAGVKMIVELEDELDRMRRRVETMGRELQRAHDRMQEELERLRRDGGRGEIVPRSLVEAVLSAMQPAPSASAREAGGGPIAVGPSSSRSRKSQAT